MEFKYLSDGKKVVVIGRLNNVESIVQEIFVTESGDEIPSGEKFTTKNLHDEPVVSWKVKDEAKQEARLQRTKNEIEKGERELSDIRTKQTALREIFKQSRILSENLGAQDFETLVSVMSGTCKYLVIDHYGRIELRKFEDGILQIDNFYGRGRYEGIKLLTLMGKSDGSLGYLLNQYKDGSGSYIRVYPFKSKDAALEMIKATIYASLEEGKFRSQKEIVGFIEMGIVFDKPALDKMRDHFLSLHETSLSQTVEAHKNGLDSNKNVVRETNALFKALAKKAN